MKNKLRILVFIAGAMAVFVFLKAIYKNYMLVDVAFNDLFALEECLHADPMHDPCLLDQTCIQKFSEKTGDNIFITNQTQYENVLQQCPKSHIPDLLVQLPKIDFDRHVIVGKRLVRYTTDMISKKLVRDDQRKEYRYILTHMKNPLSPCSSRCFSAWSDNPIEFNPEREDYRIVVQVRTGFHVFLDFITLSKTYLLKGA